MYYLKKKIELAVSHKLNLPYHSKCNNIHGHNLLVTIYCKSETLNKEKMVVDFSKIKEIANTLDHTNLNDRLEQPTSEEIAKLLTELIPNCYKVTVQESEGNETTYEV